MQVGKIQIGNYTSENTIRLNTNRETQIRKTHIEQYKSEGTHRKTKNGNKYSSEDTNRKIQIGLYISESTTRTNKKSENTNRKNTNRKIQATNTRWKVQVE